MPDPTPIVAGRSAERPFYVATGDEEELFRAAHERKLAVLMKGPTGCGKTRFVEAMAHDLGIGLVTVSCHEDLSAADLVGRHLLDEGSTRWSDGPLTRAVRSGSICYLDEVVEARQDTVVIVHSLTDHRRELPIDRLNTSLTARDDFMLVVSYNPGYQSLLKDLKHSTRQRMIGIELTWPRAEVEVEIVQVEAGVDAGTASDLVSLGQMIRDSRSAGLRELASTRTIVAAAHLIAAGIEPRAAARAAICQPLADDPHVQRGLEEVLSACF